MNHPDAIINYIAQSSFLNKQFNYTDLQVEKLAKMAVMERTGESWWIRAENIPDSSPPHCDDTITFMNIYF